MSLLVRSNVLGEHTVADDALITLVTPLIGHDVAGRWVELPSTTPGSPMSWLQSLDDPAQCFCVLDVFAAGLEVDMEVGPSELAPLQEDDPTHIRVLAVVVLDSDPSQTRANLRAPLLLATRTRLATQVVLPDENLPVQWYLAGPPPRVSLTACSS